jgi:hypothetical protein
VSTTKKAGEIEGQFTRNDCIGEEALERFAEEITHEHTGPCFSVTVQTLACDLGYLQNRGGRQLMLAVAEGTGFAPLDRRRKKSWRFSRNSQLTLCLNGRISLHIGMFALILAYPLNFSGL